MSAAMLSRYFSSKTLIEVYHKRLSIHGGITIKMIQTSPNIHRVDKDKAKYLQSFNRNMFTIKDNISVEFWYK